jgi:hypothetical protein
MTKTKTKITELEKSGLIYCLPEDIFINVISTNSKTILIDDNVLKEAQKELYHRKESERILNEIASLNNRGIHFEKEGMIGNAIIEYEKCMKVMYESIINKIRKDIAWHSPNRLRILYKKEKHPREKEFLKEFTLFCFEHDIVIPALFHKQLSK